MTWTHPGAPVPIPASLVGIDEFAELNKGNSDFGEMMQGRPLLQIERRQRRRQRRHDHVLRPSEKPIMPARSLTWLVSVHWRLPNPGRPPIENSSSPRRRRSCQKMSASIKSLIALELNAEHDASQAEFGRPSGKRM
jgi:hypothetical protein